MKSLLISILSLTSGTVLAHSGHLSAASVHGFLHTEHIIMLAAIGFVAYVVKVLHNK